MLFRSLIAMLNSDKIHPKLAFEHSGMFADAELAYKISEEYAIEQEKKAAEAAEAAAKTNPTDGDNPTDGTDGKTEETDE